MAATQVAEPAPSAVSLVPDKLHGTVTILTGTRAGALFPVESDEVFIGRAPEVDICIEDDGLSRCHARIYRDGGEHYIEDLQSTNGTYIHSQRIDQPVLLTDGTRIKVGKTMVLSFALQDVLQQRAAKKLYDQTVRDALTGLHNRRYFEDRLGTEFAYAIRHRSSVSVMVLDIDHFKSVNDTYGHQAGDAVLVRFGEILRATVRTEDLAARYGGEEFVVVSREPLPGALALAERIRKQVEVTRFSFQGQDIPVTVSIGVSNSEQATFATGDKLVAAADESLYRAKETGRNRVCS